MSIIIGNGFKLSVIETELECPICTFKFDASAKMDKAKNPTFKMKCPGCKGFVGVTVPIFGGSTKCFEWDVPAGHYRPETTAPFRVNGEKQDGTA